MATWHKHLRDAGRFAGEAIAETLWPTRCAVCDMPGAVLCERCMRSLSYLDWWRACRRCGAPFGYVQCSTCNDMALALLGRDELPFDACASAVRFDDAAGRIARCFKDQGEQRLGAVMAGLMANTLPPAWPSEAIAFVPATLAAYRHRGFDHAQLIASELSHLLGKPLASALARPKSHDQRGLDAAQRLENVRGAFRVSGKAPSIAGKRLVLVDDVYTTGATLCAATDALKAAGASEVRCLTFARV